MRSESKLQVWDEQDLSANRGGRLSPRQTANLRERLRRYLLWRLAIFSLLPAVGIALWLVILLRTGSAAGAAVAVLGGVLMGPPIAWVAWRTRRALDDVTAGGVEQVSGEVTGRIVNWRTGEAYVRIGNVRLVSFAPDADDGWKATRDFLRHGVHARAYYLPRSLLLVAAENG